MWTGRRKPLTKAQQFVNLRGNPISRGEGELRAGRLTWRYTATPSPLGRRIPHLYQQKPPRLCLYLPRTYEWQSWMRLDQTVVPWTALWLFYFEEWLVSDKWKGGGMHPDIDDDNEEAA